MGIIFDIQRLSFHDGPGLRTTVFLKGCPLRCKWCHNPESYQQQVQLRYLDDKCILCGKCVIACSNEVHRFHNNRHKLYVEQCNLNGSCVQECPTGALDFFGKDLTAKEVMDSVEKDTIFFEDSGGVTFSGGEAMQQIDFLLELLIEAKQRGIHTCVDTCGYTSWDNFLKIIPYTDCFLYDIKAITESLHQEATGKSNKLIMDNLIGLVEYQQDIYVRIPVIKEFNGHVEEMQRISEFLSRIVIQGVTLMPYHILGRSKRDMIGVNPGEVYSAPKDREMNSFKQMYIQKGIKLI
ncbi:MAG: glycyl-radical enzyme activating protein [Vallitaleaceae bacterium]|nr:glycyl-radical enzyme activating protein [Vallitaleaceae bacterium]